MGLTGSTPNHSGSAVLLQFVKSMVLLILIQIGFSSDALAQSLDIEFIAESTYVSSERIGSVTLQLAPIIPLPFARNINLRFGDQDDTAQAGADYLIPGNLNLSWPADDDSVRDVVVSIPENLPTDEGREFFTVRIVGDERLQDTTQVFISGDTGPPATDPGTFDLSVSAAQVNEDVEFVTLTVARSVGADGPVTVTLATKDASTTTADYLLESTTLSWLDDEKGPKSTTLKIIDDDLDESDEQLSVFIEDITNDGRKGAETSADITIIDNDDAGSVFAFASTTFNGSEETQKATISVSRKGASTTAAKVALGLRPDTASAPEDFSEDPLVLEWAAGEVGVRSADVVIVDDDIVEGVSQFFVFFDASGSSIGSNDSFASPTSVTVNIEDNDAFTPGNISFSATRFTAEENTGALIISLQRTGGSDGVVDATVELAPKEPISAVLAQDYTLPNNLTVRWEDQDATNKTISVPLINDDIAENTESLNAFITNVENPFFSNEGPAVQPGIASPDQADLVITDDDQVALPGLFSLSQSSYGVKEADGQVGIDIIRTGGDEGAVTLTLELTPGTATEPEDFTTPTNLTVTFASGSETPLTLNIPITNDEVTEEAEEFTVAITGLISEFDGAQFSDDPSTVTILDDDISAPGTFAISPTAYRIAEDAGSVTVTIERTAGSDGQAVVYLTDVPDTATRPEDYNFSPPPPNPDVGAPTDPRPTGIPVAFANDQTTATLNIPIVVDDVEEEDEKFSVLINSVVSEFPGADFDDVAADITILNDDRELVAGIFTLTVENPSLAENAGPVSVEVSRTGGTDGEVSITLELTAGTATATQDYTAGPLTATWQNGDGESKTLLIPLVDDDVFETDETFSVDINAIESEVPGGASSGSPITITIVNDDPQPPAGTIQFAQTSITAVEGASPVAVSLTRIGGTAGEVSVQYALSGPGAVDSRVSVNAPPGTSDNTFTWADGDDTPRSLEIVVDSNDTLDDSVELLIDLQVPTDGVQLTSSPLRNLMGTLLNGISNMSSINRNRAIQVRAPGDVLGSNTRVVVTIVDETEPQPGTFTFSAESYSQAEDAGPIEVTVQRTGGSDGVVRVAVATNDDDGDTEANPTRATPGVDYTPTDLVLEWASGDNDPQTFSIPVTADNIVEEDETLNIALLVLGEFGEGDNGEPLNPTDAAAVIIENDDEPETGTLAFNPDAYRAMENDRTVTVLVDRSAGADGPASVNWSVSGGSATQDLDFTLPAETDRTLTWSPGDAEPKSIVLGVLEDQIDDPNETIELSLSNANGAKLGDASAATITIIDTTELVSDTVTLAPGPTDLAEDIGTVSVSVQRVGEDPRAASVSYEILPDSAQLGTDYQAVAEGEIVWAAGESGMQTIDISIIDDETVENNETFTLTLSEPDNLILGTPSSRLFTIISDDMPPTPTPGSIQFSVAELTVAEDAGNATLVITRTGGTDNDVFASIRTEAIGATAGADFTAVSTELSWDDGDASSRTVNIPILPDNLQERIESFRVVLETVPDLNGTIGSPSSVLVSITDVAPPNPGTIQWSAATATVAENTSTVRLRATRTGGDAGALSIAYASADGTAEAGDDYTSVAGTLRWEDGDAAPKTVDVTILSDQLTEPTETFDVVLSNARPTIALGTPATIRVSINDVTIEEPPEPVNAGQLRFSAASGIVSEADGSFEITVERVAGDDGAASVNWATEAGTATADADYDSAMGSLQWDDGDASSRVIEVIVSADQQFEIEETLNVALSDPQGAELGVPDRFELSIADATDPQAAGRLEFAEANLRVEEATGEVNLIVRRVDGTSGPVSVNYASALGSAGDADFELVSGTLNWDDGDDSTRAINVIVATDTLVEEDEFFTVELTGAQPFGDEQLGTSEARVTIVDSTTPGILSVSESAITVSEADGTATLRVKREDGTDGAVSVAYSLLGDTAEIGVDVELEMPSGRLEWDDGDDTDKLVVVNIIADALIEEDEQVRFVLSDAAPVGDSQIGESTTELTIIDSTDIGQLVVDQMSISVNESDAEALLTVTRNGGTDGPVSVDFRTIAGTALAAIDYTQTRGQLAWVDGEGGSKQIAISILDDGIDELDDEFLTLRLENGLPTPDVLGGETIDITVVINGTRPANEGTNDYRLIIVSGDDQGGLPGDELEPMVLRTEDASGNPVSTTVYWSVVPEGSAQLLSGEVTPPDAQGLTSQRVSILSRGFLNVVASLTPPLESGARVNAPPFEAADGDAVFTIRAGIGAADGLSNNASRTGFALDAACDALQVADPVTLSADQQDLLAICGSVENQIGNDAAGLEAALDRLAPEELFYLGESIIETNDIQVSNVYARINAIRSGRADSVDLAGLSLNINDQQIPGSVVNATEEAFTGGSASADSDIALALGVFANGSISTGDVDGEGIEADADFRTSGLTFGVDYRLSDNAVIGAGLGLFINNSDFTAAGGEVNMDGTNLTLFGTWYEEDSGYVDMVLDIGRNAYDVTRRASLPGEEDRFVSGSTDADAISFTFGVGLDYSMNAWDFGPYGRFSIIRARVDGYRESSVDSQPNGATLDIRSHKVNSATFSIGGQISRSISTRQGIFVPQFRFEGEVETETKKDDIVAVFASDPTQTPFSVSGTQRDNAYANLGLGVSAIFKNGRSGYFFYETQLAHDTISQHWLKAGFRLEF